MKRWLLGLPMYAACAPADYRQLMRQIVDGLNAAGWKEPVDMPDAVDDLHAFWRSDRLLLGQACGYPLMTSLAGEVRLLGTPHYDFPGCDGYRYCSSSWWPKKPGRSPPATCAACAPPTTSRIPRAA